MSYYHTEFELRLEALNQAVRLTETAMASGSAYTGDGVVLLAEKLYAFLVPEPEVAEDAYGTFDAAEPDSTEDVEPPSLLDIMEEWLDRLGTEN